MLQGEEFCTMPNVPCKGKTRLQRNTPAGKWLRFCMIQDQTQGLSRRLRLTVVLGLYLNYSVAPEHTDSRQTVVHPQWRNFQ